MIHFKADDLAGHISRLPKNLQKKLDKQFAIIKENERYPSLQFKKVGKYWSFRIDEGYRALGREIEDGVLWFWVGTHDKYEKMINQ